MSPTYPISAVSKLTGIALDTLRAWERRYQAVTPRRSPRGRVYSEQQIKRLILLRKSVESGYAIGQVAKVRDEGLQELLDRGNSLSRPKPTQQTPVLQEELIPVLRAIEDFDYARADQELNRLATAVARPADLVHQVALPLMRTVGDRWHQGKYGIAQEHMLTSLLSTLLSSFIRIYTPSDPPARILSATPRNERHGFGTLAASMLAAAGGLGVIPLGADLPADEIVLAMRKSGADVLLLSVNKTPDGEILDDLLLIGRKVQKSALLWLGGAPEFFLDHVTRGTRWQVLHDFAAFQRELVKLGARL